MDSLTRIEGLSLLGESDHDRLVRLETLVDLHLEKGGTVEQLESKVDGINTKVLIFTGICEGAFQLGKVLFGLLK